MDKSSKSDAGYQFKPNTQYECGDCVFYLDKMKKCMLVGDADSVLAFDSCEYFVKGVPGQFGSQQLYAITKLESGYARSNFGFSCKRCEYFNVEEWKCTRVDENSEGDTPGIIHPDACCNYQSLDDVRGGLPTEVVRAMIMEGRHAISEQGASTLDVR